ncbi:MAG TPA: phosphoenolpyruvate synthase [Egibacteraceae bacterium]|nr:phosphoenolpyruvate synthase [Egibacteraceae bacterium]
MQPPLVSWLRDVDRDAVASVGGKNASLGEMIQRLGAQGIRVPDGFAVTAAAYRMFLTEGGLEETIRGHIADLQGGAPWGRVGAAIRRAILRVDLPDDLAQLIGESYRELSSRYGRDDVDVAVRSSATAEDLPEASFAGQQETFLNVKGEDDLLETVVRCFASLFTDRAIAYREEGGFAHLDVAVSVGVQKMVRSDRAGAGVAFTLDTDTGFPDVVTIDAAWGLGESVVSGMVNPDTYLVFKPLLEDDAYRPILTKQLGAKDRKVVYAAGASERTRTVHTSEQERRSYVLADDEILLLGRWAAAIERHYGRPMDIEWAKDGETDQLFVVQARPETVHSTRGPGLRTYRLTETGTVLTTGVAVGDAIATGAAVRLDSPEAADRFPDGGVLVTGMTDPDWVPIMRRAAAIVTDHGGRTAHAAIVSRELGLPAVVGTGDATEAIADGQEVTVSCAEGAEGRVYEGRLDFERRDLDVEALPRTRTRIMLNIASPAAAFRWWRLPARGIGLARVEFIINNQVGIHPLALARFDDVDDPQVRARIAERTRGYRDRAEYFVERLAHGVAQIAASQHPEPVIVRLSDFKTNEYADLLGGTQFEPEEANPMMGFRGASRYYSDHYRPGFALECQALRRVREEIGLDNVKVMVPFVRTVEEADRVLEVLADNGLQRGRNGLEIYMMVEVPANVTLADRFAERFDGFSIGSNDLTQLELGVDRDSELLAAMFDERNEAVTTRIAELLDKASVSGTPVGICGQAPSDFPEFAAFLVRGGIDSISLNPDSVIGVLERVAEVERALDEEQS